MFLINDTLDILLREVGKAHSNKINKVLDKYSMHRGQPMLLALLCEEDGLPQSTLSREMVITPATVSAMVKRMEKAGYVVRKRDSQDERVSNVYLTEAGREVSAQLSDMQDEMDEMAFKGFSKHERETMKGYLQRVLENLSE